MLALHASRIERYGGGLGIRDLGLLQAALADMVLAVADGRSSKAEVAVFLERHSRPRR